MEKSRKQMIADIVILAVITVFLFSYFKPALLFLNTTTNGGDTPSHIPTALFLKEHFLPKLRLSGWFPGAYAGMPLLQYYFPLPFLLMVLLSYFIGLEIAFKLVSMLGIFLLPICAYLCFRLMKFKFPTPALAAIFTLAFLFNEGNSMWGGNIPSTLAGEFSYSLGLALSIVYFGLLFRGINSRKYWILNAVLMFVIGITHIYTLIFVVFGSLHFLLSKKNFVENFKYLFKVYAVSFLLLGFFIVPLYAKLKYTTSYPLVWAFNSYKEFLPNVLIPFVAVAAIGFLIAQIRKFETDKFDYFIFLILTSLIFFLAAANIGVVDIRFLPFIQLSFIFMAAISIGFVAEKMKSRIFALFIILAVCLFWVASNTTYIQFWIQWNYSGFESKEPWLLYKEINDYLSGSVRDSRVVYEHSMKHDRFGTSRAFEMLPYFANRSTLEGVYMQASLSAPFIFYIQSEVSKERSCPFPSYGCTSINFSAAKRHLEMFNVKELIVISDEVKNAIKENPEYVFRKAFGEYEIYELLTNKNRYVEVLKYLPVLFETRNAPQISYLWFINSDINDVHLVFTDKVAQGDLEYFDDVVYDESLDSLPKVPIDTDCEINESVSNEEILINTTCIGKPLLIKVSNFANWQVEGAEKIYYASPSFMLIFPEQENVRVYYGTTAVDCAGLVLTGTGILILLLALIFRKKVKTKKIDMMLEILNKYKWKILAMLVAVFIILFLIKVNFLPSRTDFYTKEIAVATESYPVCEFAGKYKDDCFIEVGERTGDRNLCTARVSEARKHECYERVG
jgi:hypothetical protein